jgi:hypothetical protein
MYIIFSQTYFIRVPKRGLRWRRSFTNRCWRRSFTNRFYESLSALKPIQKLVSEAGAANDDKARTLFKSDAPEVLGAAGGIGAGAAAGAGRTNCSKPNSGGGKPALVATSDTR